MWAEVFQPARSGQFWQRKDVKLVMDSSVHYRICVDESVASRHQATQPTVFVKQRRRPGSVRRRREMKPNKPARWKAAGQDGLLRKL